jgi:hypothetical protein
MNEIPAAVLRAGPEVVAFYVKLLLRGETQRWAEMCALQQPPGVSGTDRAYMQGRLNNQQLDNMAPHQAEALIAQARKAGINVNGKYYAGGLADQRGAADPAAWVDSIADVKKVAEIRNLTVSGAVEHQGRPQPRPHVALSERATRQMMRRERANHPNMKVGELRELVVAKYGRKKK